MFRVVNALREWLEVRARVREEREFHIERAEEDLRALGVPAREAKRRARVRFGRGSFLDGLRVLGGDAAGLGRLVVAHRVLASAWVQPVALLVAIATVFAVSPTRREIIDGMIVRVRTVKAPDAVTLSVQARRWWSGRTDRTDVEVGPAQVVWMTIGVYGLFLLARRAREAGVGPWFWYGLGAGCLHAAASMAVFAWAIQMRPRGAGGAVAFVAWLIVAAVQCRWWWSDLEARCPRCLERTVLPLTDGAADRVLIDAAMTESVCVNGHGVLVESRWVKEFNLTANERE